MYHIRRSGLCGCGKTEWWNILRTSYEGSECRLADGVLDVGLARFSSLATERSVVSDFSKRVTHQAGVETYQLSHWRATNYALLYQSPFQLAASHGFNMRGSRFARCFASRSAQSNQKNESEARKEVSTIEDPFDAPTSNIPEKPVTFTEGASYSLVILAGLGVAAAAAYGVFKELIFEPKEYKIFNKALERVQNDSQVRVRIGSPITGYGSESRNRAARQRIPNRTWTDEDGIEHVLVNFHVRGPHGAGKVHAEMFKDSVDKQWKFVYLIVEVTSPSQAQLMLESYVPA